MFNRTQFFSVMRELTPISAPLPCYGLHQSTRNPLCQACLHFEGCRVAMGSRANRVSLDKTVFDLIPSGLNRGFVEPFDPETDIDAIYQATYLLIFGDNPGQTVGKFTDRIILLARQAGLSVPKYILVNMVGFQLAWPDKPFNPGCLVDNRALYRAKTYGQVCIKKFGTVDVTAMDRLTKSDNAQYELSTRFLETEIKVGKWIIDWKLDNDGPPYEALFDALELELDINWLATEARYTERLRRYIQVSNATANSHEIADKHRLLKKRKHESYANFVYRQLILPQAVAAVLGEYNYHPEDFERPNTPVTDALLFWHRLALAIVHMECLKCVDLNQGFYAAK